RTPAVLGRELVVVPLANRGVGCIARLQRAAGGAGFNTRLADARPARLAPVDFAAHARSLGALAEHVSGVAQLGEALARARVADRSAVVVIDTDPSRTNEAGGWWWDVAGPEVPDRTEVNVALHGYGASQPHRRN